MSRTLRKAVENAKQKKETDITLVEEGIAHLEEVPELCEFVCEKLHMNISSPPPSLTHTHTLSLTLSL